MDKKQKKVAKVMKKFKKGKLSIGKSDKKVKNRKQAIAIALREANIRRKDGHLEGGVEIEATNPQETQEQEVQGQGNVRPEKKRKAKWY